MTVTQKGRRRMTKAIALMTFLVDRVWLVAERYPMI